MSEWKKVTFLDVVSLNPRISLEKGVEYPFVEMSNSLPGARKPEKDVYQKYSGGGAKFEEGDTVVARIEPCLQNGKGFQCPYKKGFGSTEFLVFRPMNLREMDYNFLYYYMGQQSIREAMAKTMVGASGRQRVNNSVFNDLLINLPPLNIQQEIATILSRYDSLIENYQKQIKLLEEEAQRLYKEWFVDLRFPGHENTKIVDGVPEGWGKKKLIELVDVQYGYAFDGKLFNNNGEGMPILRIRNIPDSITSDYTTEEASKDYIVHNGDIVVGMDGIFHINSWSGGDAYLVQRACSFRPKKAELKGVIFQAIQEPIKFFEKTLVGATVAHLGKKHIDSIELCVPNNLELYQPFSMFYNQRQGLLSQIRLLVEARDRLLPKLMSGEI